MEWVSLMAGSRYEGSKARIAAMVEVLGPQPWMEYKPLVWVFFGLSYTICLGWRARLGRNRDAVSVERKRHLMIYQIQEYVHFAGFRDDYGWKKTCTILSMRF